MSKQAIFQAAFDKAEAIEFDQEWSNGTGYFDHAVYGDSAPRLAPGKMVKCTTPGNRRIIIVSTILGNVVVFDRYSGNEQGVFVYNTTNAIDRLGMIRNKSLDEEDLAIILGCDWDSDTIATRLQSVCDGLKKMEQRFNRRA